MPADASPSSWRWKISIVGMDALSSEWLATLVERLVSTPILGLGTYRPGYRPPWLGQSVATQVALPRLTARDSLAVVQSVLPTMPLPEAVCQECTDIWSRPQVDARET